MAIVEGLNTREVAIMVGVIVLKEAAGNVGATSVSVKCTILKFKNFFIKVKKLMKINAARKKLMMSS